MKKLYPVFQFIRYWLHKVNEHSLHSPFLYNFYTEIIKHDANQGFEDLEDLRTSLLNSTESVKVKELGAGSRVDNGQTRKIKDIAKHASTPPAFSRLLNRIIHWGKFKHVLELGTSLGQNTLYMQKACTEGIIYTLEGSPAIAEIAKHNFHKLNANNIHVVEGNIDDTLTTTLEKLDTLDLAYLDANHRYTPTIQYFNSILPKLHKDSIVVIDDIHWSAEMNQAWLELKQHPKVTLSLDLFEGGLLFFNPDLKKEHYILSF